MGSSHNDNLSPIPFLDDPNNLLCLTMIRCKGGRDPEHIGFGTLNPLSDLVPTHSKMVITGIELERTSIIEGIEISKVGEFRKDGN
jgi:hypothetical protein